MTDRDDRSTEQRGLFDDQDRQPQLIEYDWVHQPRPEKQVPIGIIEALLAELNLEEDEDA